MAKSRKGVRNGQWRSRLNAAMENPEFAARVLTILRDKVAQMEQDATVTAQAAAAKLEELDAQIAALGSTGA